MAWDTSAVARGRCDGISSPYLRARTFSPTGSFRRKAYVDMSSYTLSPSQDFESSLPHHARSYSQFFGSKAPPTPFSPLTPTSPSFGPSPVDSQRPSTMMTMMMGSERAEPAMSVKVHFRFEDPVRAQYSRSYASSTNFEVNDKLLTGLVRRIDHCSKELITRKDFTALDDIREQTGTLKPLRYEVAFQICLRGSGVWTERVYSSFQKNPLNMDNAKDVILSAHRMIGLFLLRHDKDFIWVDGPVKEQFPMGPELSQPIIGFPTPLTCVPRSRFIETSQTFESFPGYTIELLLSSRWRRRQPMPWEKVIRVNSRQSTPLNLPTAEQVFWKLARRVDEAIETRKTVFEDLHKLCDGLDGTYQCHHYEENAFEMNVSITNHLGPAFTHLHRNFRTDMILFPDPDNIDCEAFLNTLKPVFAESRDKADRTIDDLNDLDMRIVELRGRGWAVERPLTLTLGSSGSYSRRSVEAILERVETAIHHVLNGNDVICRVTAHKRGHLILDKTLLAQRERGIFRLDIPNPELEKKAFVNRLETRIYDELAMVCMDTCSLQDFPDFDIKVAHPATDPVVVPKENPVPAPQNTAQPLVPDRAVEPAPAVSHAVRQGSDAASSTASDATPGEAEAPEDTVHSKYRWGKLVPDGRGSPHIDAEAAFVYPETPENETAAAKTQPPTRCITSPSDFAPKASEPSLETPPLSDPIWQPTEEQDSNMSPYATVENSPDDSILSNSSERNTNPSEVEYQDKTLDAIVGTPVPNAQFKLPCEITPQSDHDSLNSTDTKESVHSRPSTKHEDSIPPTPSLGMSPPNGNSPRNSLLITPQYFTNTGATGRFVDVRGDSSDDGRPSFDLPESPILATKRHGAMLEMSGTLVMEPGIDQSGSLPSPVESSSSDHNHNLPSMSSSQKTIQAFPESDREPPRTVDEPPQGRKDGSIADVVGRAEPEAPVAMVVGSMVEISAPTEPDVLPPPVDTVPPESNVIERETLAKRHLDPKKRQSIHTDDVVFGAFEKLILSPTVAPTPELSIDEKLIEVPVEEYSLEFLDSSNSCEVGALMTGYDKPKSLDSDVFEESKIPSTNIIPLEEATSLPSVANDEINHNDDHLSFPEYDFHEATPNEGLRPDSSFATMRPKSPDIDVTTLDPHLDTQVLKLKNDEETPIPIANQREDSIEEYLHLDSIPISLPDEADNLELDVEPGTDGIDIDASSLQGAAVSVQDSAMFKTSDPYNVTEPSTQPGANALARKAFVDSKSDCGDRVSLAHLTAETSCITVVPHSPEMPALVPTYLRNDGHVDTGSDAFDAEGGFEDDDAIIAQFEKLSRNSLVGHRDTVASSDVTTKSMPQHQPASSAEEDEASTLVYALAREEYNLPLKLSGDKQQQPTPEEPSSQAPISAPPTSEATPPSNTPLILLQDRGEEADSCSIPRQIPEVAHALDITLSDDLWLAASVPIPDGEDEDIFAGSGIETDPTSQIPHEKIPVVSEMPNSFKPSVEADTVTSGPEFYSFKAQDELQPTIDILPSLEGEIHANGNVDVNPPVKTTAPEEPTAERYATEPQTAQEPESSGQNVLAVPVKQQLSQQPIHALKYLELTHTPRSSARTVGTVAEDHSYPQVSETFPDLVISPVQSRPEQRLSISIGHADCSLLSPTAGDEDSLQTPKAQLDQDYFSIPPSGPALPNLITAVPSSHLPLHPSSSPSLYSSAADRPRTSISTFLSATTDNEPKTSYERLAIEDMPTATTTPRSPFFSASAGYFGLWQHEEKKRVEIIGLKDALMGSFRKVSGHVSLSSRPSTAGNGDSGEKGKEKEKEKEKDKRRIRWSRERRRGKSVDTATLAKPTSSLSGRKLVKRNPLVVDDEVPHVPAIPPQHQAGCQQHPHQNQHDHKSDPNPNPASRMAKEKGRDDDNVNIYDGPRASFASSHRRSKDVPVTAHPFKTTTTMDDDGQALPRLMMIFAGVTIAGKMLVGSGGGSG